MAGDFIDPTESAPGPRVGMMPPRGQVGGFVDPTEQMQSAPPEQPPAEMPMAAAAGPAPSEGQPPAGLEARVNDFLKRNGLAEGYGKWVAYPVERGVSAVLGAPGEIADLGQRGAAYLAGQGYRALGMEDTSKRDLADSQKLNFFPKSEDVRQSLFGNNTDAVKAESTAGRIAQEGLTAALGGAPVGRLAAGLGAISGAASEGAGQATEGTSMEPWARIAGAFLPLGVAAGVSQRQRVPDMVKRTMGDATDAQLAQAQKLMDDAATAGTPLTSAEAIAQVTGNNKTPLLAGQRYVENSSRETPGVAYLKRLMGGRAEGNRTAFDAEVPKSSRPVNEIAPAVQSVAKGELNAARKETNRLSQPDYDATTGNKTTGIPSHVLSPAGQAQLEKNVVITNAIRDVRADPAGYGDLRNSGDWSMDVLDAAKKRLDHMERDAINAGHGSKTGNIDTARRELLDVADAEYPRYAFARLIQTIRQKDVEEPLRRSPTGKMADAEKLTQQWETIFTRNPAEVSPNQVRDAVALIAKNDPALANDFVNRYLQRAFRVTEGKAADQSRVGSRVERKLFSDDDVGANIEAALKALPDGNTRWASFRRLMDIFEAQGNRLPVNSATESNQVIAGQLKTGGIQSAAKAAVNPPGTMKQALEWWQYGRNTERLAQALTGDVANLRRILLIGPSDERAAIKAIAVLEGGNLAATPRE